jgi:hypothetical protein
MSALRRYPDFFIVGAQRSGTTWLYEALRAHPQVFMSAHKETHYFSQDRLRLDADLVVRSESAYLNLFARAPNPHLCGEASPSYLWHPDAAQRIYAQQPRAKIIAILRHPIERAFSQYRMDLADGMRPVSFYDAIQRACQRGEKVYGTGDLYVELGLYAEQLTRYVKVFPRARVLLLDFRDLVSDARTLLKRVAAFLEIDAAGFTEEAMRAHNQTVMPRNAAVRRVLEFRSARQLYRALVPPRLRRAVRARAFVHGVSAKPEPAAVDFLRSVYLPDERVLRERFGNFYELV